MNDPQPHVQSAIACRDVRAWGLSLVADLGRRGLLAMEPGPAGPYERTPPPPLDVDALTPAQRRVCGAFAPSTSGLSTSGLSTSAYVIPTTEIVDEARAAGLMKYHTWTDRDRSMGVSLLLVVPALVCTVTSLVLMIPNPREGRPHWDLITLAAIFAVIFWIGTYLGASTVRGLTPAGRRLRTALREQQGGRIDQLRTGSPAAVAALIGSSLPEILAVGPLRPVFAALEARTDCTFPDLTWCRAWDGSPLDGPGLAAALKGLMARGLIPYTGPIGEAAP